jgi:DNA-binding protein HU-beta
MTKAELIDRVHRTKGIDISKKATETLINSVFDQIRAAVKKEKRFSYPGFGTFSRRERKARKGRNPQTGEVINIKKSTTVTFKPAAAFKKQINR